MIQLSIEGFKLVELYKSISGPRLGIAHIPILFNAFGINLNNIRKIVFYASERNIHTLIIPYSAAFGPVIELYSKNMRAEEFRRRYGIDEEHPYLRTLKYLSANYGLNIISPAIMERSGSKYYVSTVFISFEDVEEHSSQRKILVSSDEEKIGVNPGREIIVFDDHYLKYMALISREILVPEFGRIGSMRGCNTLVATISPLKPVENYVDIVKTLAQMLDRWVIHVGGIFVVEDNKYVLNSMIMDPEGRLVTIYSDSVPALISIPYKEMTSRIHEANKEETIGILKFVSGQLRRLEK
ncbi:carbon-nitrogen hydrolase family protein [Desulfurococcus amylolyticus]|uniref:carbon-nitrogen hydrolase family protein n=1 Tax=Desulfurococcus amylolyticus TaxID=94694 RepID=UPI001E3A93FE|nr:carbon-nitrogen hydrolase family protein [Desulfurococcus amylolyticus]